MRLIITSPIASIVEADNVAHVQAEDPSGSFGILPGHADFLTALSISVLSWSDFDGVVNHAAVDGGVFTVRNGDTVNLATRHAVVDDDLAALETNVIQSFRDSAEAEAQHRSAASRLQLAAIRQVQRYLRPELSPGHPLSQATSRQTGGPEF